jgi:hypothetical protein
MSGVKVNVVYEFLEKPSKGLRNDDKMAGEGQITGELDKLPETPEEWKNISRDIALAMDYAAVAVTHIVPLEQIEKFVNPENDLVEGEIIDES